MRVVSRKGKLDPGDARVKQELRPSRGSNSIKSPMAVPSRGQGAGYCERCQPAPQQAVRLPVSVSAVVQQLRCLLWSQLAALTLPCSLAGACPREGAAIGDSIEFDPREVVTHF